MAMVLDQLGDVVAPETPALPAFDAKDIEPADEAADRAVAGMSQSFTARIKTRAFAAICGLGNWSGD